MKQLVYIRQGATFYRVVTLYEDAARTTPLNLTNKTPRATLMNRRGVKLADFSCGVLDAVAGTLVWSMSRETTAGLATGRVGFADIDLDDVDGVTTDPAASYEIQVNPGQVKPVVVP